MVRKRARDERERRATGKETRNLSLASRASRASSSDGLFFRSSGRTDIAPRSGNNRHGHAATPRTREERTAGRRAGRRVAFRGRKEGDVPGDHSSLAICTLVYSVVPLGTAPARKGGSSVGRRSARRRCATRERGGGRTARLTRQREDRQRRDRLPVSGGRPRLRHGRLSGARARGAPLVLSRDVSRQQWTLAPEKSQAQLLSRVENRKNSFDPGRQTLSRRVPRFAATERRLAPTAPDDAGSSPRARRRARGAGAAGVGKKAASTED